MILLLFGLLFGIGYVGLAFIAAVIKVFMEGDEQ